MYYTTEKIGPKRSLTPEGYLLCYDVPIARTGEMLYAPQELPQLVPGRDGIIHVLRSSDDVFSPDTAASFNGKPICDDHPAVDVTSANWREHACGVVQNVRRDGEMLVADMMVTVADMISEVQAGKREVSCGYQADYEQLSDGIARQFNIVGNHVAIVRAGRCGPACAIGDSSSKMAVRKTRAARILEAVQAGDADTLAETISEHAAPEIHVHTHVNTSDEDDPKKDDDDPEPDKAEEKKTSDEDPIAAMSERIDRIEDSLASVKDAIAKFNKDADPEPETEAKATEDEETGNLEELADPGIRVEGVTIVGDSRDLVEQFRETLAVAEILAPGIGIPTFDAKSPSAKTIDTLCDLRRRALTAAFADASKREQVAKVLAGRKPEFAKMTCDAVYGLFVGAGALVRDANNKRPYAGVTFGSSAAQRPTVADFAKRAAEMWARK